MLIFSSVGIILSLIRSDKLAKIDLQLAIFIVMKNRHELLFSLHLHLMAIVLPVRTTEETPTETEWEGEWEADLGEWAENDLSVLNCQQFTFLYAIFSGLIKI